MAAILVRPLTYESEKQIIAGKTRGITVEHRIPILSDEEKHQQLRTVEEGLFNIFVKYAPPNLDKTIAN